MKLNLGSGFPGYTSEGFNVITSNTANWKLIDICADCHPDECYDITLGIREANNTVAEIWMGDFFEHLLRVKAKFVLSECFRVLQVGGSVTMAVPDMSVVMPRWIANDGFGDENNLIWGCQDETHQKNCIPDSHFAGYTQTSLTKTLNNAGFTNVTKIDISKRWYELAVRAFKK